MAYFEESQVGEPILGPNDGVIDHLFDAAVVATVGVQFIVGEIRARATKRVGAVRVGIHSLVQSFTDPNELDN